MSQRYLVHLSVPLGRCASR